MRLAALLAAAAFAVEAAPAAAPQFSASVSAARWSELRHTYRAGCPVAPAQLRTIRMTYWGFDGRLHTGVLIVHRSVADDIVAVFRRLYDARFPIRRMVSVTRYRGDDDASMAADNTSAFNCRRVSGSSSWSMHAYGLAIDVNPVENPYVLGGRVQPPSGRAYLDRERGRPGMAYDGGVLVRAFASRRWKWGGRWRNSRDYQHFSTNGR